MNIKKIIDTTFRKKNSNKIKNSFINKKDFQVITNFSQKNINKKLGVDNSISSYEDNDIKVNTSWKRFNQLNSITINPSYKFLEKNSRIMTIGSCFANEIRKSFIKSSSFKMLPEVDQSIKDCFCDYFKNSYTINDQWDIMPHFQYYNTFSILLEFEKAFNIWHQEDSDYYKCKGYGEEKEVFVDPYRRYIEAKSVDDFIIIKNSMDKSYKNAIFNSDIIIITLGMTELFKRKDNNRAVCQFEPRLKEYIYFENSDFQNNYNNLNKICELIFNNFPEKKLVVTVSPIPLLQTFRNCDIFIANTQSKSTLRAVIGELESKWNNLFYFPSYEISMNYNDGFEEDKRHIKPQLADFIINSFSNSFLK
jgi:hypothetical protein